MAVIGCDIPVRQVVGAEQLASAQTGIWTKTHFYQQGPYLHAKTFLVAAGEPSVLEFRIDLRPLEKVAARIHQRLHESRARTSGQPAIGFSFSKAFKSIKSAAKSIGKSKLIKAVGGAIKTVAKSKLVGALATGLAVAVPVVGVPALAAYGTAHAAIKAVDKGKKLAHVATTAKQTIAKASSQTQKLAAAKAQAGERAKAAADAANARATAQARQIAAKAKASAARVPTASASVKAQAAAQAKATLAAGQHAATSAAKNVVAQVQTAEKKVAPVVAAAARIQAKLADPAVKAKLLAIKAQADSANKVLSDIKEKAKSGTGAEKLDAQKNAAIVNLVAKNQARIQQMSQQNAGGLPAMLIDSRGRITRGKFKVVAKAGGKNPDVLYQGPKQKAQSGAFSRVSGVPGIGAAHDAHARWWTLEIKPKGSNRWISLQSNGILFREHWQAGKATDWYSKRGIPAKAVTAKYTPTPSELLKAQNRIAGVPELHDDIPGETVGAHSPFPPLSPREKQAKQAEYEAWLRKHGGRRSPRIGWTSSPAWATTVSGDDDPEVIGAAWSRSPQDSGRLWAGDKVKFFVDGKSHNGRIQQKSHLPNHLVIKATRQSGGRIYTSVPRNNVYAVDVKDRKNHDLLYEVGWSSPPAWTSPPGSIGCDCEGTQF